MSEQGKCPKCKSENLNYETIVNNNEEIYYPFVCDDCGFAGNEWYSLQFITMTDNETGKEA